MSISSEIDRIEGAKEDIANAIEDMGVTVPSGTKIDGLATLIRSGVNGHIQNTSNPHQVTAAQAGAISKLPDHIISGEAGWYRFFTTSLLLGNTNKIIFLITETYATVRSAIIIAYLNRTSSSGANSTCTLNMLSGVSLYSDFGYTIDGASISLYYNKYSNSNGNVAIQVLYSENRLGNTYIDLTEKWENVSISSIPSTIRYANPPQDGNGNSIKDTYGTKAGTISFSLSWSGSGPYTQTVTVTGATVTSNSVINLRPTDPQLGQLLADGVQTLTVENNNGTLTAYVRGTAAPSTAMTMACNVVEEV